jgi:hypothetical protein
MRFDGVLFNGVVGIDDDTQGNLINMNNNNRIISLLNYLFANNEPNESIFT